MWISHRSLELVANWPKNRTENQRTETMSWQKQQKAICFGEGETDVLHDQKAAFNLPFPYRFHLPTHAEKFRHVSFFCHITVLLAGAGAGRPARFQGEGQPNQTQTKIPTWTQWFNQWIMFCIQNPLSLSKYQYQLQFKRDVTMSRIPFSPLFCPLPPTQHSTCTYI